MWGSQSMADAVDALYMDIEGMKFDKLWKENLGEITSW